VQEESQAQEASGLRKAGTKEICSIESQKAVGTQGEEEVMRSPIRLALWAGLAALAVALLNAPAALATSPWWHFTSNIRPSTIKLGGEGVIGFRALNVGDGPTTSENANGEPNPVTITATLPEGVSVLPVSPENPEPNVTLHTFPETDLGTANCSEPSPRRVRCTYEPEPPISPLLNPYEDVEMSVAIKVNADPSGPSTAEVSGGGAPAASLKRSLTVGESPPGFEVEDQGFSLVPEAEGGGIDARAGSHPFQLTTNFALNQTSDPLHPPALPRDLKFALPSGLVANAAAFPRCSESAFLEKGFGQGFSDQCPQESAVGVIVLQVFQTFLATAPIQTYPVPVFNLTPRPGEPVRFGFYFAGIAVPIDFSIRTGGDYGANATVGNITQIANFLSESLTIWGVPGHSDHDESRGWGCLVGGFYKAFGKPECSPSPQAQRPTPFLTMPTSCATPFAASVEGDAWPTKANPGGAQLPAQEYSLQDSFGRAIGLTTCGQLPFDPFIEVAPDGQQASTPTGLTVNVRVPQDVNENADGLAASSLKDITVALPQGVAVNPSGANGLQACSEGLIGYLPGSSSPPNELHFTPRLPGSVLALEAGETAPLQPGVNFCSTASKIGTVDIASPLLPAMQHLTGAVYLASQNENPFGSLIAAYIVAEDPTSGVLVKLPGEVHLTESGRIVTSFKNSPQLPFEDAKLHFFGGERAPLATPARCGAYTTDANFAPWSGGEPAESSSTFQISSGPHGGPCPGAPLPFSPSLMGGTTNVNAGSFSPLTTTIGREDGQQDMQSVQLHMPAGLEGILTGVTLCPNSQAEAGTCGPDSLIGETTVSAGVGSDPVSVTGGKVYLTEKYAGAPFGLSIVNPVKTGPFDLEHDTSNPSQQPACDCIVVRARIEVDPRTAALTITTDPSGPHAIPHLIDGVPVQIQKVNVTVTRNHFTFNPTNCKPLTLTGVIAGAEGGLGPVSAPFQVTNCAALRFSPKFSVSTSGHTSKANGASLAVKLTYPPAPSGTYVNLAKAKVSLPKQLPSRLTTLQKACTAATFEANPANCPADSVVGRAKVMTPVLPVPLEGPAYFVSHGGEAFPDLTIVLHGYGVTVDLVGATQIKNGITTSTFKATPDVPFSTFELNLPTGKFSALTANTNLCTAKLAMPTEFTAQNGAVLTQSTPIAVTGCSTRLSIVSHSVKQRTLTLRVYAPAAGKLRVWGKGLTSSTTTAKAREVLKLVVKANRAGTFKTQVKLAFASTTGRRQVKSLHAQLK
jgi:hypothetical protein